MFATRMVFPQTRFTPTQKISTEPMSERWKIAISVMIGETSLAGKVMVPSNTRTGIAEHTPLGYENLEAKKVMDLNNPPETIWPDEEYFVLDEGTGKYICSICGYVYDPAEHDGVAFEDLPEDWKCLRCRQGKEKFNKA